MKVALAQINPVVGDLQGNAAKIREFHARAAATGAGLVVFPEMALVGYPPLDLVGRRGFLSQAQQQLEALAGQLERVPALVGTALPNPEATGRPARNVAALLSGGTIAGVQAKSRLPTYDVFDEDRYFEPARQRQPLPLPGCALGVVICEDIWQGPEEGRHRYPVDPVAELQQAGIDVLVNLSASPFHAGRGQERETRLAEVARATGRPVVLVNQVGGNDSLLFDGRSLAVNPAGKCIARAGAFQEDLVLVDLEGGTGDLRPCPPEGPQEIAAALVMGLRDYADKCGFNRAVLGLSGGVDSALVAVLAAEALGPTRVRALAMPSVYSSPHSRSDAELLARNLGIEFVVEPIPEILAAYRRVLQGALGEIGQTLTEENLQARIRGALIMAHANHTGALALATGNKSELATGYCTLYGDMAGGMAPIGDLFKRQVYELARHLNRHAEIIPRRTLERPPSAELRPNQTDQDTLPPYEVLDPILDLILTEGLGPDEITERGFAPATVQGIMQLVERSEHKRRQAAPVLRVTRRAFGAGRQIPVARGLHRRRPA